MGERSEKQGRSYRVRTTSGVGVPVFFSRSDTFAEVYHSQPFARDELFVLSLALAVSARFVLRVCSAFVCTFV